MRIVHLAILIAFSLILFASRPEHASQATGQIKLYTPLISCGQECKGQTSTPTRSTQPSPTATITTSYSAIRLEALRLINLERVRIGCPAAIIQPNLMAATQAWAEYMDQSGDYRHSPPDWNARFGYFLETFENIGSAETSDQIVNAWMSSPQHRSNMLDCAYTKPSSPDYISGAIDEIGIGKSSNYWTFGLATRLP